MSFSMSLAERGLLPDFIIRMGIRHQLKSRLAEVYAGSPEEQDDRYRQFKNYLSTGEISEHSEESKKQHYEVPAEFFAMTFGKNVKYSSGYWPLQETTLDESEDHMLELTCLRAQLQDGQTILELGCGWGSLTLWMAEHFPNSKITAVSNALGQKKHIEEKAKKKGLQNIEVVTTNVKDFQAEANTYDRIVSVEMFEHLRNYCELLKRCSSWLKDEGKIFIHVFCHHEFGYQFETTKTPSWMAENFFSGGVMPSDRLFYELDTPLKVESHWAVSGIHYAKTCEAVLKNIDLKKTKIKELFEKTYGKNEADLWIQKWRIFYMAYAETFKFRGGTEWCVSHNLLRK